MYGLAGPGVGSGSTVARLSKYSRWSLVENPNRAIHLSDSRLVAVDLDAPEPLVVARRGPCTRRRRRQRRRRHLGRRDRPCSTAR